MNRFLQKNIINFLIISFLAVISTFIPFLGHFYNVTMDGVYHFGRFQEIADSLKNLELPQIFNFKYVSVSSYEGVAINSFYPWLTGLIFIVPKILIINPMWAIAAGFFVLNLITIYSSKLLMQYISSNHLLIYTGVIIYQFNNYHFLDMYSRSAIGESIAYAFIPLVFLGLLKIFDNDKTGYIVLGLSMGLIINSHVLSFVFGIVIIFFFVLSKFLLKKLTLNNIGEIFKAGFIGLIVGFYSIYNIIIVSLNNGIVQPPKSIFPLNMNDFFYSLLKNDLNEKMFTTWNLGLPIMVVMTLLFFKSLKNNNKKWTSWIVLSSLLFLSLFDWWPYGIFVKTPLNIFQFLGRFLVLVIIMFSIGFVLYLNDKKIKKSLIFMFDIVVIAFSLSATFQMHNSPTGETLWDHSKLNSANYYKTIENSYTFAEFLPQGSNEKNNIENSLKTGKLKIIPKNTGVVFKLERKVGETVSLPAVLYKGFNYDLYKNGVKINKIKYGVLKIKTESINNVIELESKNNINSVAFIISIVGFFASLVLLLRRGKV